MVEKSVFSFKAGQILMMDGEKPRDKILILQSGKIRTVNRIVATTEETGPGSLVGLVSALLNQPPQESVTAVTDVTGFSIKRDMLKSFFEANPSIVVKIFQTLAQQRASVETLLAFVLTGQETMTAPLVSDPGALYHIGQAYEQAGVNPVACYAYDKYLSDNPEGPDVAAARDRKDALAIYAVDMPHYESSQVEQQYPPNTVLFMEGEKGDNFYLVRSGMVRIAKIIGNKRVMLGVLRSGNILGDSNVNAGVLRNYTAVARDNCSVMSIQFKTMETVAQKNAALFFHFIGTLAARIWYTCKEIELVRTKKNQERIYDFLSLQFLVHHVNAKSDNPFRFDFSGTELLNMTGSDNERGKEILQKALDSRSLLESDGRLETARISSLAKAFTR
jgi:CRP/FNR family transcriptional regulator